MRKAGESDETGRVHYRHYASLPKPAEGNVSDEESRLVPNTWRGDDEFSRTKRAKFMKEARAFVARLVKDRPKPKDMAIPPAQEDEED